MLEYKEGIAILTCPLYEDLVGVEKISKVEWIHGVKPCQEYCTIKITEAGFVTRIYAAEKSTYKALITLDSGIQVSTTYYSINKFGMFVV